MQDPSTSRMNAQARTSWRQRRPADPGATASEGTAV
jgi:hypothetical protein